MDMRVSMTTTHQVQLNVIVSKKVSVDVECQMMLTALNALLIVRLDSAIVETVARGVAHAADSFSIMLRIKNYGCAFAYRAR